MTARDQRQIRSIDLVAWLREDRTVVLYLPDREEVRLVASRAELRNRHSDARKWVQAKVDQPPSDWDQRAILTVPGVVWTVSSDTCATGRLSAPDNIAYDAFWREFIFRQPRNPIELAAIMSADSEEVFACYRFDGLSRWTTASVAAWTEDMHVVLGYVQHVLSTEPASEMTDSLRAYQAYLTSADFTDYLGQLRTYLGSA